MATQTEQEGSMPDIQKIVPCLWFDDRAEEAAKFYTSVFDNSRILQVSRYPEAGQDVHGKPAGSVMTVEFELAGQSFTALNGGPHFTFDEAISLQVMCDTQEELDYYWDRLSEGGSPRQCGWLEDRFGLSWQVVPSRLNEILSDHESEGFRRAFEAMLGMEKLDLEELERAYAGRARAT